MRWNALPWPVLGADGFRRPLRSGDLDSALPALAEVVVLLPSLGLVITCGATALDAWMRHLTSVRSADRAPVPTLAVPHPSPANGHRREDAERRTRAAFEAAAALVADRQ